MAARHAAQASVGENSFSSSNAVFLRLHDGASSHGQSLRVINEQSVQVNHTNFAVTQVLPRKLSQRDVFATIGAPIIDNLLQGQDVLLLSLGERGAGKTHTLFGSDSNRGMCPRFIEALFSPRYGHLGLQIAVSLWECVGRQQRDLLARESAQDSEEAIVALCVTDVSDFMRIYSYGRRRSASWGTDGSSLYAMPTTSHVLFRVMVWHPGTHVGSTLTVIDTAAPTTSSPTLAHFTMTSAAGPASKPATTLLDIDLRNADAVLRGKPFVRDSRLCDCLASLTPSARTYLLLCCAPDSRDTTGLVRDLGLAQAILAADPQCEVKRFSGPAEFFSSPICSDSPLHNMAPDTTYLFTTPATRADRRHENVDSTPYQPRHRITVLDSSLPLSSAPPSWQRNPDSGMPSGLPSPSNMTTDDLISMFSPVPAAAPRSRYDSPDSAWGSGGSAYQASPGDAYAQLAKAQRALQNRRATKLDELEETVAYLTAENEKLSLERQQQAARQARLEGQIADLEGERAAAAALTRGLLNDIDALTHSHAEALQRHRDASRAEAAVQHEREAVLRAEATELREKLERVRVTVDRLKKDRASFSRVASKLTEILTAAHTATTSCEAHAQSCMARNYLGTRARKVHAETRHVLELLIIFARSIDVSDEARSRISATIAKIEEKE
eukprot:m.137923 g.137923  ORF g.137923 m.137923 type:complete len:669 (-) comp14912_c0_seq2:27-2033(-)